MIVARAQLRGDGVVDISSAGDHQEEEDAGSSRREELALNCSRAARPPEALKRALSAILLGLFLSWAFAGVILRCVRRKSTNKKKQVLICCRAREEESKDTLAGCSTQSSPHIPQEQVCVAADGIQCIPLTFPGIFQALCRNTCICVL